MSRPDSSHPTAGALDVPFTMHEQDLPVLMGALKYFPACTACRQLRSIDAIVVFEIDLDLGEQRMAFVPMCLGCRGKLQGPSTKNALVARIRERMENWTMPFTFEVRTEGGGGQ
jgi:hypothetical protein